MKNFKELSLHLSCIEISELNSICVYFNLPKKKLIISSGSISKNYYYIYEGIIRVYCISEEGKELTVFIIENSFFGAPESIINNLPTKYYFETITDVKLYKFNIRRIEKLAFRYENIFNIYIDGLKSVITALVNRVDGFVDKNPEQRLLELYKEQPFIIDKIDKKIIASILGVSPNSLSRIISRIKNKNN